MVKKLKVFHGLVNYGTQAGLFAKELRNQGIQAISVTYPDKFKRQTDIELLFGGNMPQKIFKHSWNWIRRFYWFFKYNTFHFYYGTTLFPRQLDLPLFKLLGKKVIMEYLGYDVQLYQKSIEKYELTNVKFYYSHEESIKADKKKIKRLKWETKYLDKQLVCAPYISEFVPKSEVLPLAIDLTEYEFKSRAVPADGFIILHAPTHRGNKGTEYILSAISELKESGYNIKLNLIENISHKELKTKYLEADIFIDQIVGGWYGTAAIEAMALGIPTVCFIRASYFEYINYGNEIPIVNADPRTLTNVLKNLIDNKELLSKIGARSSEFVKKYHSIEIITERLIKIYEGLHSIK
jgi:glycosyltransferase involved in cell wall biosynthesis